MQLAKCEAVGNNRLTQRVAIGKDVRRFQQLVVAQLADRAEGNLRQDGRLEIAS